MIFHDMTVHYQGEVYPAFAARSDVERREFHDAVREGQVMRGDSELSGLELRIARATLLGTYANVPPPYDPTENGPVRALIPGLQNFGTVPMLGGPPKVGKTDLVIDLAVSLVMPGRRFLGSFESADLTDEERGGDVWLINAEHPPDEVHSLLLSLGLEFDNTDPQVPFYSVEGGGALIVEHLAISMGGADAFDLTVPERFELWEYKLTHGGGAPPLYVIADGVTRILGSNTDRYGGWYDQFVKLLRMIDCPTGLAVGHTGLHTGHLMQGVESLAGPDGLWLYDAREPWKNAKAARYFSAVPRGRGPSVPSTRVVMTDNRLVAGTNEDRAPVADKVASDEFADEIRLALGGAGTVGLLTTEITGRGDIGQIKRNTLDGMVLAGEVVRRDEQKGRARGIRWWLSAVAPS